MAWTAPATFVDGNVLAASDMNTYVRDNMLETMPALATGQLRWFVANGANRLVERQLFKEYVDASETTSTTSYTDLNTVGPSISVTTGTRALVFWVSTLSNSTANVSGTIGITVSGATSVAANDNQALIVPLWDALNPKRLGIAELFTGLTAGSNTFTMKYKVSAGNGTFGKRQLIVMAL